MLLGCFTSMNNPTNILYSTEPLNLGLSADDEGLYTKKATRKVETMAQKVDVIAVGCLPLKSPT